ARTTCAEIHRPGRWRSFGLKAAVDRATVDIAAFLWITNYLWKGLWKTQPVGCGYLGAGEFNAHRDGHLGVQPDLDLVRPCGLDRVRDEDLPAVDLRAAGGAHRIGDVARADRAEQAAVRASAPLEPDGQPLQLPGDRLRVLEGPDLTRRAGPLDQVNLLLATARPRDRESAGQQVVASI